MELLPIPLTSALDKINHKYENIICFEEWITWNPHEIEKLQQVGITTIEDTINIFYSIIQSKKEERIKPIENSQKGISILKGKGKELIAISGRLETSRSYTENWLDKNFSGAFEKVLLTNQDTSDRIPKYELAKLHDIGLIIEDNAHYAIDLANRGIPIILLENPWNKNIDTS